MKTQFIPVVMSVVGIVLLAVFGPRSLSVVARVFSDSSSFGDVGNAQFVWAALGVFVFSTAEAILLFSKRMSGTTVTAIVGRVTQITGFGVALCALFFGIRALLDLASPWSMITPEELTIEFNSNAKMLTIGLCIVVVGQLVITSGRFSNQWIPSLETAKRGSAIATIFKRLSTVVVFLILLLILALFVFTTFFEFALIDVLQGEEQGLAVIAQNFHGMVLYPFIAYFLAAIYCLVDCVRVIVFDRGRIKCQNAE